MFGHACSWCSCLQQLLTGVTRREEKVSLLKFSLFSWQIFVFIVTERWESARETAAVSQFCFMLMYTVCVLWRQVVRVNDVYVLLLPHWSDTAISSWVQPLHRSTAALQPTVVRCLQFNSSLRNQVVLLWSSVKQRPLISKDHFLSKGFPEISLLHSTESSPWTSEKDRDVVGDQKWINTPAL